MNATGTPETRDRNNATFRVIDGPRLNRSSLELVRARLLREATCNHLRPLAPITGLYIPPWNSKPLSERSGRLTFSRSHRSYHQVLDQVRRSASDCRVAAVTVKFSEKAARQVVASSRKGGRSFINTYAGRINKRLRDNGIHAAWFGVVEDSGDQGRAKLSGLHVHLTVTYHIEDEAKIKAIFRKDKRDGNSFMTWKSEHEGQPINVGWSDYQVKHLSRHSKYLPKGSERVYCPNDIRSEGKCLYETQRLRVVSLEDHREELEGRPFSQVWGYIRNGRSLPSHEPEPFDWELHESEALEKQANSANALDCAPGLIRKSAQEAAQAATGIDPIGQDSDPEFAALLASLDDSEFPDDPTPGAGLPTLAEPRVVERCQPMEWT